LLKTEFVDCEKCAKKEAELKQKQINTPSAENEELTQNFDHEYINLLAYPLIIIITFILLAAYLVL
jgi:hypothetical protein